MELTHNELINRIVWFIYTNEQSKPNMIKYYKW